MQSLIDKIEKEGIYLGNGIIKVDAFMNHQIDTELMAEIGREFASKFRSHQPTKILTAESSGIPPAMVTGYELKIPVVYARKKTPLTMSGAPLTAQAPSRTKGGMTTLMVSPDYLAEGDRVLLIEDFLATGQTAVALIDITHQSGAELVGVGCVIEKIFEPGRTQIQQKFSGPIVSLAKINLLGEKIEITD
ncbi:MAG: xanthine phosphoribosyltransferase [Chloroflexota bacterium]